MMWRVVALGLAMALASLILLNMFGLVLAPGFIDYQKAGSWGDFIAAFGTVGAVWIALYTILREAEKARQLNEQLLEERRLEKTQVYAWPEYAAGEWRINLRNDLHAPIYRWEVLIRGKKAAQSEILGPIFPGVRPLVVHELRSLAATLTPTIEFRFEAPDMRWWQRDERGNLTVIEPPESGGGQ